MTLRHGHRGTLGSKALRRAQALTLLAAAACGDSTDDDADKGQVIYATVSSTHEVLAIDDETHAIRKHYAVGKGPAIIVGTPGLEKLYTANWADNSVSAIDVARNQVKNLALASKPYVVAVDAEGSRVYAGLLGNSIAVIDTTTDQVVREFPTTQLPASLIVSPDGKTLYVATIDLLGLGLTKGKLYAISTTDGHEVHAPIEVGRVPAWITISPDGSKVYTLNFLSDDVSVVDTTSFSVVTTVSTGAGSMGIIGNVSPDGSRLWVTNHGTSELIAIDTQSNEIVQTIPLTGRPVGVQLSPDGERVYTTDFGTKSKSEPPQVNYLLTGQFNATGDGQVRAFDVASGKPVGSTVSVAAGPTSVVIGPTAH